MDDSSHGSILRRLREERDWSMADLAAKSGVRKPSIQVYEGGTVPNVAAALRIAQALGTRVEDIWGGLALPSADADDTPGVA